MAGAPLAERLAVPRYAVRRIPSRALELPLLPFGILLVVVLSALFAPVIAPHDPFAVNVMVRLTPPVWQQGGDPDYLLGTDALGRDVLSRLITGARISLFVAVMTVLVAGSIGVTLGVASGYFGGVLDRVVMRLVDIQLSLPSTLMAVGLAGVLTPGIQNIILILTIWSWAGFARLTRAEAMALRRRDFVALATVAGCGPGRILLRHVMPNLLNTVIVLATLYVAQIILFEAGLSFLGLGVQNPTPSWGNMLADGREYIVDAWWLAVLPGLALLLTCLAANLLGDWLRDALDPKLRNL